jgi:hypothetical protein
MAAKLTLDLNAMQDDFFADTELIGIRASMPAYRFCWLINTYFHFNFTRDPEFDIKMETPTGQDIYFEVYQYVLPQNSGKYIIYKLRSSEIHLLPEIKNLDFIWLVQSTTPLEDANMLLKHCRNINEIELAQTIPLDRLKKKQFLLI